MSETVLVTGANGFLGQHVVRQLEDDPDVREIRALDLCKYVDRVGHSSRVPVESICEDLTDESACASAFKGVDVVIHCAGLIDRNFPADESALEKNNVLATKVVVSLCKKNSIGRLVMTSTAEVVLVPFMRCVPPFSLIINQTEARAVPPDSPDSDILTPYAASKLRAERIVLEANGSRLEDGGILRTVALRPPLMYGEQDETLVPGLLRLAKLFDNTLFQIGGSSNRQQHAYVGNVAWAHICAKKALKYESDEDNVPSAQAVAGLPVFINDDTPKGDVLRLTQLLLTFPEVNPNARSLIKVQPCTLPSWIWFLGAFFVETAVGFTSIRLPVAPKAFLRYLSSVVMLSRLRAETRLQYVPKFTPEESISRSRQYYARVKHLVS